MKNSKPPESLQVRPIRVSFEISSLQVSVLFAITIVFFMYQVGFVVGEAFAHYMNAKG